MHSCYAARLAGAAIALGLMGFAAVVPAVPAFAALASAAPAFAAPASAAPASAGHLVAAASQGPVVTVTPDVAEPGDSVEIDTDGCGLDNFATASSPAFASSIDLKPVEEDFRLVGVAKVDQNADPGQYTVSVECAEGASIEGQLRVVPPGGPNTGGGGLASSGGIGQGVAGTAGGGIGRGPGTGGLPAGQGVALLAMLGLGALTGAVILVRARRRPPDPS